MTRRLQADPPALPDLIAICDRLQERATTIERLQREQDADLRDVLRLAERTRQRDPFARDSLRLLSVAELSELTGLSADALYKLVQRGELPMRKVGGSLRIGVQEYREWWRGRAS